MRESNRGVMIGVAALTVVLVVIGGVVLFRGGGGGSEATLAVQSVPNDLTLKLDGHEIPANGEVKIKAGEHTLEGSRSGFQSYTETFVSAGEPLSYKMYLYANSAEGREWARKNPSQQAELEEQASRRFDEIQRRLRIKYPILKQLPYVGDGFKATYAKSKSDPTNPEALSIVIEVFGSQGRKKALQWIEDRGWDINTLDVIWTTGK